MKKKMIITMIFLLLFGLTACGKDNTLGTYDGNSVTSINVGVYGSYESISDSVQQEEVLAQLSGLSYTESDSNSFISEQYAIELTYEAGDGCIIYFDFTDYNYEVVPFDATGNVLYEESICYTSTEEELKELEKLYHD